MPRWSMAIVEARDIVVKVLIDCRILRNTRPGLAQDSISQIVLSRHESDQDEKKKQVRPVRSQIFLDTHILMYI